MSISTAIASICVRCWATVWHWCSWLPASTAKRDEAAASEPNLIASLRDDEAHVALRVGELLLPDIPPGKLDAKFTLAKDILDVERLDYSAEGAIALNGKGHIEHLSEAPSGQVDFALQAATADGLRVGSELLGMSESVSKSKAACRLCAARHACRPDRGQGRQQDESVGRIQGQRRRRQCRADRQGGWRAGQARRSGVSTSTAPSRATVPKFCWACLSPDLHPSGWRPPVPIRASSR